MPVTPALAGVRVLERTVSIAGQSAGMLLADLGADVVRLAGPNDAEAVGLPGWLCWNRGKTIIAEPAGLGRLIERADVWLCDAPPSELVTCGLDADTLSLAAPALVQVWLPAVAPSGRWCELPHDQLLLDAIGGFAAHHPATEERPVASVVPTRPLVQGALAAVAALTGLLARQGDGWGRAATVSGLHAEATTLNTLVSRSVDGPPLVAPGKLLPGSPNFRLYRAGDGHWLFLAALSPELFIKALDVLDRLDVLARPEVAGDFVNLLRPEVGVVVGAELEAVFATGPAGSWLEAMAAAGVPAAAVGDPATWLTGEVVAHACPPVRVAVAGVGPVVMPGPPVLLAANPAVAGRPPSPSTAGHADGVWTDVSPQPRPVGEPPGPGDRPLHGLRVVDLATFLAGPFVSTLLAYHGAEVVKVEAPAGDPYSVFTASYAIVNEHKRRLTADLRDPRARSAVVELIGSADVVVDNLLASSLGRLGLPPEVFEAANPDLVRCSLTAYGAAGPFAELPGFDPIMQTLSGLVSVQGGRGRPVATAAPVHDVAAGCLGALGVLAALWVRRRDGHGQRVATSLAAVSTYLQAGELTTYPGRPARPVGGPDFPGPSSWQRFYRAADRWLAVSATSPAHRAALLDVLGRPDLAGAADGERAEAMEAVVAGRSGEEWLGPLGAAGVPACAAVNRVELDDPFLVAHRYSHVVDTPEVGRLEMVSGYTDWRHTDRRPPLPVGQWRTDPAGVLARWSGRRRW